MRFHSDDYINFLRIITPDNMHDYLRQLQRCNALYFFVLPKVFLGQMLDRSYVVYVMISVNVGEDCPVFDGLFEFCQLYTSGSIGRLRWYCLYCIISNWVVPSGGAVRLNQQQSDIVINWAGNNICCEQLKA